MPTVGGYTGILDIKFLGGTSLKNHPLQYSTTLGHGHLQLGAFTSGLWQVQSVGEGDQQQPGQGGQSTGRVVRGRRRMQGHWAGINVVLYTTDSIQYTVYTWPTRPRWPVSGASDAGCLQVLADTCITATALTGQWALTGHWLNKTGCRSTEQCQIQVVLYSTIIQPWQWQ